MKCAQVRAKTTIFVHGRSCTTHVNARPCGCCDYLQKGEQFTVLDTVPIDDRNYYVAFTEFGIVTFYFLASEENTFLDVVEKTVIPTGQAA